MLNFDSMPLFKPHAYKIFKLIPQWAMAYGVSEKAIIKQIPIAHAWIQSNPGKGPKKQVTRFLFNWMRRAKEFGNLKEDSNFKAYVEERPKDEDLPDEAFFKQLKGEIKR